MSDTEAKVDEEKNVDNDIVQEVEAEKEDANVERPDGHLDWEDDEEGEPMIPVTTPYTPP